MTTRPERIPYDEPQTWYFTFGVGGDQPNRNCYFVIEDVPGEVARDRMNQVFNRRWAFQYDAHDWFEDGVSQAEKYGLRRIA